MRSLWRLSAFLRPYRWQVLLALLALFGLTAAQLAFPAIIRQVIDVGLAQQEVRFLFLSAFLILGLGLLRALFNYCQRYLSEWIAAHIGYDLRNRLYDHIQRLPFSYHDHAQTGQLISRCIEDVRSIERFTGYGVVDLLRMSLLLVGIVSLLFSQNARLAAIVLLPMIPLAFLTGGFGRRIGKYFLAVDNALGELASRLQENVIGAQVVRAFAREDYEMERFDEANRALYDSRVRVNSEWARILPSSHFLVTLGTILILWFCGGYLPAS